MTHCVQILQETGPLMSSELAIHLEKRFGIIKNTASQTVSRDKSISKIKGFYSSRQAFCFLEADKDSPDFFDKLLESMFVHGKKYWYCLNALKMNGGIISQRYLESYTNYPVVPLKSHLPFKKVLQNFVSEGILIYNDDQFLLTPKFNVTFTNYVHYKTIEAIKDTVLDNFHSLCKNIGLISFDSGELFGEYGKFRFGFKGPSYVTGLIEDGKNGFVVADVLIGHPIYEKDVSFFVDKIKTIKQFQKSSRLIPFLLVDDLDKDALALLKKNGIVVGFIGELFGKKYAETLKELIGILNNAGASLKQSPEKYIDLIKELKKYNEGLANNIKGTLFEFVIGHFHSVKCQSIDLGREIIDEDGRHEMDVLSFYSDKIVVSECKATKSKIDFEAIEKWGDRKLPAFFKWIKKQETHKEKEIEFEYWSTSGFTEGAEERLEHLSKTTKKYKVSCFGSKDIRENALKMKNKKLKEVIDNFFLKSKV